MKEKVIELEQTHAKSLFQGEEKYLERNKKPEKFHRKSQSFLLI